MTDYTELELKAFELSGRDTSSSLSVTCLALISELPSSEYSPEDLYQSIQSKQLWLISPGVCRIQIIVDQNRMSNLGNEEEAEFLEHLAEAICRCSVWSNLGVTIKREDIHYQPLYDGAPNLYFIVEHPDKSSVLLSPPHSPTGRFNGIECLFRYYTDSSEGSQPDTERSDMSDVDVGRDFTEADLPLQDPDRINETYESALPSHCLEDPAIYGPQNQDRVRWDDAARLAQMALCVIIGIRKCMQGVRVSHLNTKPSLLELAPAIWNAHYLKMMTLHATSFLIISNILASSSRGQSPSLRQKSEKLLLNDDVPDKDSPVDMEIGANLGTYRNCVERRLWNLTQTTLEPTIRAKKPAIRFYLQRAEADNEILEPIPLDVDDLDEYGSPNLAVFEDIDDSDVDWENDIETGWSLHQLPILEAQSDDYDSDTAVEYQQWWCEEEDIEFADESSLGSVKQEELDSQLGLGLPDTTFSQPSSPEELYDIATPQDYDPSESNDTIPDIDNMYIIEYEGGDDETYSTMDGFISNPEDLLWDESQRREVYICANNPLGMELGDENCHPNEDYEDVEMYQQY
ncbi:hypothetical protein F5Y04DRAFT_276698 [Hypomontagnella monticulosa]|nr:hypothetical protein F5Y04DRAFT_276698 [Hypomontagnella monticulosa]